ncbi:MAG: flavin-dependent dehydrogenase [Cyclobacteriaceae bacterium]|jgi:flavin-dependent dehydrogenase
MYDVAIVGGGLAGLINSILLIRAGLKVILFEKKTFPFHRVCGEYISNEVIPFLENNDLYPSMFNPTSISELELSAINGDTFVHRLDLGGFGISRFVYDHWLCEKADAAGVAVHQNTRVTKIEFLDNYHSIQTNIGSDPIFSKIVIGSQGKRSKLDQSLSRSFLSMKSPYVGVKYHIKADLPVDRISLHNFDGGYCGVSRIEDDKYNMCYLTHRDQIRKHGGIPTFEKVVMTKNPQLRHIFNYSKFLFEKPEVINEITFEKKEPVLNHIFMCGDAAGMITPLCGNGMAMAIHSSKLLSNLIINAFNSDPFNREKLEANYTKAWTDEFAFRLWSGRKIQSLFGSGMSSQFGVLIGKYLKPVSRFLISQTHGKPFN